MGKISSFRGQLLYSVIISLIYFLIQIALLHIFDIKIYFYFALTQLLFFSVLLCIIYLYFKQRWQISLGNFANTILLFILFSFSFVITFPVTMDRSFSVFMLGSIYNLQNANTPITLPDLEKITQAYFFENNMVDKRIREQLATGSIKLDNGKIIMTNKGKFIALSDMFIGYLFNLNRNNFDPRIK